MQNHWRVVQNQGSTKFGLRWSPGGSGIDFSLILGVLLGGLGVPGTSLGHPLEDFVFQLLFNEKQDSSQVVSWW